MDNSGFVEISAMGECSVVIKFNDKIDIKTHLAISALGEYLDNNPFKGMIEYVPAFVSMTIFYNPLEVIRSVESQKELENKTAYEIVADKVKNIVNNIGKDSKVISRIVEIPVCYGGEFGPDLEYVAKYNNISKEKVIDIHSSCDNRVYMIGFAPGFPYLAGMSDKIAVPRKNTPRLCIPAGSVGIAGSQTGVYPISTPGGWQLIGQTPLELFKPDSDIPSIIKAGDIVRFKAISKAEYYDFKFRNQGELKWA